MNSHNDAMMDKMGDEIDDLQRRLDKAEAERDGAREAARMIWNDTGREYVQTDDMQTLDPLECWPWLGEA